MRRHDLDARLHTLLDEYGHVLRRAIALTARGGGVDVDDVEQEARVRIWKALRRQRELAKPASFFYRVAVTTTIDALRRLRARREESLEASRPGTGVGRGPRTRRFELIRDPAASPEAAASSRQKLDQVGEALSCLPANRRRAVGLHLQGFNTREISELLGWTEPKARNLLYRGLKTLRTQLSEREGAVREVV